jgi:predicted Zn-dependent protease
VLYGAALAATQSRDFGSARTYLKRLQALPGPDKHAARLMRLLEVEITLAAGDAVPAAAILTELAALRKGERGVPRPELFLQAQTAVQLSQSGLAGAGAALSDAVQWLQVRVAEYPKDALAWQWLSSCHAAQGQNLRAIRAEAETQVARLDYAAALDRFKAAQELVYQQRGANRAEAASEHIDASIIDTRKRQVEALFKEQSLDR